MFGGPPTSKEFMRQVMAEYGPNSPRSRMTVVAYLIEHGGGPQVVGLKEFLTHAEGIMEFITTGIAALQTDMEQFEDIDVDGEPEEPKEDNTEQGYTYL